MSILYIEVCVLLETFVSKHLPLRVAIIKEDTHKEIHTPKAYMPSHRAINKARTVISIEHRATVSI